MQLKPKPALTTLPTGLARQRMEDAVNVYHPGYCPPLPLLSLAATDPGGIYYGVLYYACCTLAGNIWDETEGRGPQSTGPFFSHDTDPSSERLVFTNDIAPPGRYYFHVPPYSPGSPYPIVSKFADWLFPESLPRPWADLKAEWATPTTIVPTVSNPLRTPCRITGTYPVQNTHVMPISSNRWLKTNNMRRFYRPSWRGRQTEDCPQNKIWLRNDLHYYHDENKIMLFPKRDDDNQRRYSLATHVLNPPDKTEDDGVEAITLYQNIPTLPFPYVPVEFLFARFAWAIFTNRVVELFADADTDDDTEYAIYTVVFENNTRSYQDIKLRFGQFAQLPPKATGTSRQSLTGVQLSTGVGHQSSTGEKRDRSQVDQDDAADDHPVHSGREMVYSLRTGRMEWDMDDQPTRERGELVYSLRTGRLEWEQDDGGLDSDHSASDHSVGDHSSDDTDTDDEHERPTKRSRSRSYSSHEGHGNFEIERKSAPSSEHPVSEHPVSEHAVPDLAGSTISSFSSSDQSSNHSASLNHTLPRPDVLSDVLSNVTNDPSNVSRDMSSKVPMKASRGFYTRVANNRSR